MSRSKYVVYDTLKDTVHRTIISYASSKKEAERECEILSSREEGNCSYDYCTKKEWEEKIRKLRQLLSPGAHNQT